MPFRDLVLFGALAVLIFTIPKRPFVGALAWVVFGVLNPHRLSWGYAYNFPFAQVIALLTLGAMLVTKDHRELKGGAAGVMLLVILAWAGINSLFAFNPGPGFDYLIFVAKVYLMTAVLLILSHTRKHAEAIVWSLVVSLGFYGIKGGLFVLATGGNYRVNGPPGSVMEGNNSLGVGLVIVIPLMYYLLRQIHGRWTRWLRPAFMFSMALCAVSVLGSYSRGALLSIFAMLVLLWLRGRSKVLVLLGALAFVLLAIPFMPEQWVNRMNTIETYDQDASAMGRIIAWETAYKIAKDRFPLGGGFEYQSLETSMRYSPVPDVVLVAHSLYFQTMGSLGFIGVLLLATFWILVWWQCAWLRSRSRGKPDLEWAYTLGSMVQVSLVGYFVGGAFLNLAFWDLPYYLYTAVAAAKFAVSNDLNVAASAIETPNAKNSVQLGAIGVRN